MSYPDQPPNVHNDFQDFEAGDSQQQFRQPSQNSQSWQNTLQSNQQQQNNYQGNNNQGNNGNYQKPYQKNNNWKGNNNNQGGGKPWQKNNNWQNKGQNQSGERQHQPPVENPTLYLPYAALGNKDAEQSILDSFKRIVTKLEENGYIARTGGMEGIEELVERTAANHELYLPWKSFASKESKFTYNNPLVQGIAKKFHPSWDNLKPPLQAFLSKGVRVLCGQNCNSLALFLLCWSKDGVDNVKDKTYESANVGHAVAVAAAHHIPVFNLGKPGTEERLYQFLGIQ